MLGRVNQSKVQLSKLNQSKISPIKQEKSLGKIMSSTLLSKLWKILDMVRDRQRRAETGRVWQSNKILSFVRERLVELSRVRQIICKTEIHCPKSSCPEQQQQQQEEVISAFLEPAFRNSVAAQVKNSCFFAICGHTTVNLAKIRPPSRQLQYTKFFLTL